MCRACASHSIAMCQLGDIVCFKWGYVGAVVAHRGCWSEKFGFIVKNAVFAFLGSEPVVMKWTCASLKTELSERGHCRVYVVSN